MMSLTRGWQRALGAAFGAMVADLLPATGIMVAIVIGMMLAWASLTSDGDDLLTAMAAGYLTGVLGWELANLTIGLTWPTV
jgi:flagellar motor component MotA